MCTRLFEQFIDKDYYKLGIYEWLEMKINNLLYFW